MLHVGHRHELRNMTSNLSCSREWGLTNMTVMEWLRFNLSEWQKNMRILTDLPYTQHYLSTCRGKKKESKSVLSLFMCPGITLGQKKKVLGLVLLIIQKCNWAIPQNVWHFRPQDIIYKNDWKLTLKHIFLLSKLCCTLS